MENRAIQKHEGEGWEFVSQTPGKLRSELTFRRPKKNIPTRLVAIAGGALVLLVILGVGIAVIASQGGDDDKPTAADSPSATETEPSEEPTASETPSEEPPPSETPTSEAPEPYVYEGPEYEVIVTDANQGPGGLTQYWVLTNPFNYGNNAYQDQVRFIIEDVARTEGTTKLIVQVVSLDEVAFGESPSTFQDFIAEHGQDYAINVLPQKEEMHWVASFTGGVNPNTGKPSDSDSAYEIIWRPYATSEIETWKPEIE